MQVRRSKITEHQASCASDGRGVARIDLSYLIATALGGEAYPPTI